MVIKVLRLCLPQLKEVVIKAVHIIQVISRHFVHVIDFALTGHIVTDSGPTFHDKTPQRFLANKICPEKEKASSMTLIHEMIDSLSSSPLVLFTTMILLLTPDYRTSWCPASYTNNGNRAL